MKLSTKIMITLVIAGMVCIASVFSLVRCCSSNVEEWKTVSEITREIELLNCKKLNFSMDLVSQTGNQVFFRGSSIVDFQYCDSVKAPVLSISETLADGVEFSMGENNDLTVDIHPAGSLYTCEEPMVITLLLPTVPSDMNISLPHSLGTHFRNISTDSLNIVYPDWGWVDFYDASIDYLSIRNNGDIKLYDSHIGTLLSDIHRENNMHISIKALESSQVDTLELTGGKYECNVRGIDPRSVITRPDTTSWIKIINFYTVEN